jgi:molybdopterin-containing oxidoreductase family molybdopterin binding subunit
MDSKLKMVYTACQGWACHDYCVLSTFVDENGVLDHCEPMFVPEHISTNEHQQMPGCFKDRSGICAKGAASVKLPYIKERLRYPMKRVGERNSGEWERISWDQALKEIADKLAEIRKKYGHHSVLINYFPCGVPNYNNGLAMALCFRFSEAYGVSVMEQEAIDLCDIIGPTTWSGEIYLLLNTNNDRMNNSDYVVIWGGNPYGGTRAASTTTIFSNIKDKGAKIVDIGVLYDASAANANQFIGIKAASDTALVFAVAKIIIDSERYDENFLLTETNAPFLVREDTGKFLREFDVDPEGLDSYVIWDKTDRVAKPVPRCYHDMEDYDADLFAEVTLSGIRCKSALRKIRERVSPYTPEYQERFTSVPAQTVRMFAEEYISHKNALIWMGAGLRYKNSIETSRAIALLPLLTGKLYNEAAGISFEASGKNWPVGFNTLGIWTEGLPELPAVSVPLQHVLDSFKDPTRQQYRAFINLAGNPVHNWPPRAMWRDTIFPEMELIVTADIRMSETCMFADYVLPAANTFEREELVLTGNCLVYCEPALQPIEEARDDCDIIADLARHVGVGEYFEKTRDEWRNIWLDTDDPCVATIEPKITMERMRDDKVVALNTPPEMYHFYRQNEPRTPSGRYEFYVEELSEFKGGAVVDRQLALIDNEEQRQKYPLHLFIGRSRFFVQGQFREIEELDRLAGDGPRVGMNRDDAAARGIREGDLVEVFNDKGVCRVPVHFSNFIPPGMAHLWYAYGVNQFKDSEPAVALGSETGVGEALSEISVFWNPLVKQRLIAMGVPEGLTYMDGELGCETIWDVLCDVRRAD